MAIVSYCPSGERIFTFLPKTVEKRETLAPFPFLRFIYLFALNAPPFSSAGFCVANSPEKDVSPPLNPFSHAPKREAIKASHQKDGTNGAAAPLREKGSHEPRDSEV